MFRYVYIAAFGLIGMCLPGVHRRLGRAERRVDSPANIARN